MKIKYLKKKSSLSNIKNDFTGLVKIRFENSYDTYHYKNGKLHNESGPASIEFRDSKETESKWYLEGKEYSEVEFNKKIQDMNIIIFSYANFVPKDFTGVCRVESIKQKRFYKNGKLHREDGPAVEDDNGSKYWYKKSLSHHENGPAIEYTNGTKEWWVNGKCHREDGPAVEYASGGKEWRVNNLLHREDGPAIVWSDGFKQWFIKGDKYSEKEFNKKIELMNMKEFYYNLIPTGFTGVCKIKDRNNEIRHYKNGNIHNESGPAIISSYNTKQWLIDGVHHRLDGPAIERGDGVNFWYIKGREYTKEKYDEKIKSLSIKEFKDYQYVPNDFTGTCKLTANNQILHYKNGNLHREDGPAVEYEDFRKEWYLNGKLHREDGPAFEGKYNKSWYKNGSLHREDGPAIEWYDGKKEWLIDSVHHRLDGPAIECTDGAKFWYIKGHEYTKEKYEDKLKNLSIKEFKEMHSIPKDFTGIAKVRDIIIYLKAGVRHREDGPAFENVSGDKSWWINNKKHREDGPAVEYADGQKKWYINNQLHRLDGPAIERPNGTKTWYINGIEYFSEKDFNSKIFEMNIKEFSDEEDVPKDFTGIAKINGVSTTIYFKNGKRHREDGPAYEDIHGNKSWWLNDNIHRIGGPAVEYEDGQKDWYIEGKRHRTDGPAIEYANGNKYWYLNGQKHREDGPAIELTNGNKEWWLNGKIHRLDGPAIELASGHKTWYIEGTQYKENEFNENIQKMNKKQFWSLDKIPKDFTGIADIYDINSTVYLKDGKYHREDGPAFKDINNNKKWYKDGQLHRTDGPAVEYARGSLEWYVDGKRHRTDGPAKEYVNGAKEWWVNGLLHREGGPARKLSGGSKEWFFNGLLHRIDGPAVEYVDGKKSWYIDGVKYTEKDFNEKISKINIKEFLSEDDVPKDFTGISKIKETNSIIYFKDGKRHREDGPACENEHGKSWSINGQLHRLDGPAIECTDGAKFWYIEGDEVYSEEEFNKKIKYMNIEEFKDYTYVPSDFTGVCKIKNYNEIHHYKDGKLHREDGPAIEAANGRKAWFIHGKRHRLDGPAIEHADGIKYWYINNINHTEQVFNKIKDIPSFKDTTFVPKDFTGVCYLVGPNEIIHYKDGKIHNEKDYAVENFTSGNKAWYKNGKRHRLDGPARQRKYEDHEWWIEGKHFSKEKFDEKIKTMNMVSHKYQYLRDIPIDFTGICEVSFNNEIHYYKNGRLHREDGPACESIDSDFKSWHIDGKYHRMDGPAIEYADGRKEWFIEGIECSEEVFNKRISDMNMQKFKYTSDVPKGFTGICKITMEDEIHYYKNGSFHREDGPAIEYADGEKWYINGKLHREDGPAIEQSNGYKSWYLNGKLHREDGPAVEDYGIKYWCKNGEYHREDGPAIECEDGRKEWWINNKRHREDGPAIECADGTKMWYLNGKRHREDGPAIENANGISTYYLHNIIVDAKDHSDIVKLGYKFQKDHHLEPKSNYTGVIISDNEDIAFYKDGGLHRENNPAIIYSSGSKMWALNDKMHRLDGPSFTSKSTDFWHKDGVLHREDGPAMIIKEINAQKYFIDGKELSLNEFKIFQNGTRERPKKIDDNWIMPDNFTGVVDHEGHLKTYKMGLLHSENDLPSYESKDVKNWHKNGELHRIDNPAVEAGDYKYWYIDGECVKSFSNGKYYDGNGLLIQPKIIKQVKKATYRVAAEKTTNIIREIITKKIADKSNYPTANFIMSSPVGKSMLQSAIGIVINQLPYDNEYMNTFSEELLVSSISNIENSLIDSMFKSISFDINSSIKQIRIDQAHIVDNEVEDEDIYHSINQSSFL